MYNSQSVRKLRTLKSVVAEDMILTVAYYLLFLMYVQNKMNLATLFLVTMVYIIRVFTIRHEKSHLGNSQNSALLDFLSNYFTPYLTIYQEPYIEKKIKHLQHHKSHVDGDFASDFSKDPHYILEHGPWYKAFAASVFYEEVMFYLDFKRYGGISPARRKMLLIAPILVAVQIYAFGFLNFLALMGCYRVGMCLVWFFFSYIMHMNLFYGHSEKIKQNTPRFVFHATELLMGSSNSTVVMFHKFHHDYPNKFIDFTNDSYKTDGSI